MEDLTARDRGVTDELVEAINTVHAEFGARRS
ncbi:hypothetical protein FHX42_003964 [Saccharopolyspora lacisalsi]|uniref:Uncharacterized protein n=1 Tax=Halosaccharopolyspora lacisalsi TaxID=1000566 RepID=A0A839E451_9PSEU|nr:hypothetical protein [Halosaccharopolyspora lacisalsi]